jgi:uncharacterized protein YcaQ
LSAAEARRVALAAQQLDGSGRVRSSSAAAAAALAGRGPSLAKVRRTATDLLALQIDTVNTLVRAHYLPLYSRLGPYDVRHLDRLTNVTHDLVETRFGHQASYVPVELEPYLRWRGEAWRRRRPLTWRERADAAYVAEVERQVVERGPLALSDLVDARRAPRVTPEEATIRRLDGQPYSATSLLWHRSSEGKTALDGLLAEGRLALAGRRGVERLYDLTERVLPASVRSVATPPVADAVRELVRRSAVAVGVGTVADVAGYFGLLLGDARRALDDLVSSGDVAVVEVEGWTKPAYLARGARVPRTVSAVALLGVFDSLTWSRERTRRVFGFDFSFEIYVPEPERRYGYYVLPFLLGESLVARVDLKADRPRSRRVVAGAWAEEGVVVRADVGADVVGELRAELERMAAWLGLASVVVPRGARGGPLVRALRR